MSHFPENWTRARIGDLCDLINGYPFSQRDWKQTGLPIIRIQNLNNSSAAYNYFSGEIQDKYLIENGNLLFAWSGTPGTSFGAHVWSGGNAVLNQHIFRIDFDSNNLDRDYFKHAINQQLEELIDKAHGGVGLRHLTKGKFQDTEIPLPPLTEQKEIVDCLNQFFTRLNLIKKALCEISNLNKEYKDNVLRSFFGPAASKQSIPLVSLVQEGPANGWSPKTGPDAKGALALKLTATTSGELRLDDQAVKRVFDVPNSNSKYWLEPGDLLVQRANSLEHLGAAAIYQGPMQTYIYPDLMMRLRISDTDTRRYIWRYLNSSYGRKYFRERATGTAGNMPKINGSILRSMPVPLPQENNFQKANQLIDRAFLRIDAISSEISKVQSLIGYLEKEILKKAFRGELSTRKVETESAMVLLEKIKLERAFKKTSVTKADKAVVKEKIILKRGLNIMSKKQDNIANNYLFQKLISLGGRGSPKELWSDSDLEIEDFYKQLRIEIKSGNIQEGKNKNELVAKK